MAQQENSYSPTPPVLPPQRAVGPSATNIAARWGFALLLGVGVGVAAGVNTRADGAVSVGVLGLAALLSVLVDRRLPRKGVALGLTLAGLLPFVLVCAAAIALSLATNSAFLLIAAALPLGVAAGFALGLGGQSRDDKVYVAIVAGIMAWVGAGLDLLGSLAIHLLSPEFQRPEELITTLFVMVAIGVGVVFGSPVAGLGGWLGELLRRRLAQAAGFPRAQAQA